jgi:hypothetical protein
MDDWSLVAGNISTLTIKQSSVAVSFRYRKPLYGTYLISCNIDHCLAARTQKSKFYATILVLHTIVCIAVYVSLPTVVPFYAKCLKCINLKRYKYIASYEIRTYSD